MKVIYAIINLKNGKKYIGSSVNFSRRKSEHLRDLNKNTHHSISLQRSWNRNTPDNYQFLILEKIEEGISIVEREQFYIDKYQSSDKEYGYNMCSIAYDPNSYKKHKEVYQYTLDGKFIGKFKDCVEAAKALNCAGSGISACCREQYRFYKGFIWTYESELSKERIYLANNPVKRTEEAKKKMSDAAKNRTDNLKPILQYDLNGNFIKEWESTSHLVKEKGYSNGYISDCLYGKHQKAYGYIWKFK